MSRGRKTTYATGFLIHSRMLLTAGHKLAWSPSGNIWHAKLFFGLVDATHHIASQDLELDNSNRFFNGGY